LLFIVIMLNKVNYWHARLDHLAASFHYGDTFHIDSGKLKSIGKLECRI
jgi:hypothetical protein